MNPMQRLAHRFIFSRIRVRVPVLISTILIESFLSHSQFQVRVDNCPKLRHDRSVSHSFEIIILKSFFRSMPYCLSYMKRFK